MTSPGDFDMQSTCASARSRGAESSDRCAVGCGPPQPVPSMITQAQRRDRNDPQGNKRGR